MDALADCGAPECTGDEDFSNESLTKVPLLGVCRHRLSVDGRGVVTLVAFMGCPLRCRYCLNEHCHDMKHTSKRVTPRQLLDEVMIDNLYFLATDGGITFGGGEPLLHSQFITDFCQIADPRWTISLETSLNVPLEHLRRVFPYIDHYIIDVKDMNPDIYERYTLLSRDHLIANLRWLMSNIDDVSKVEVRLPHIPSYNTQSDVDHSRAMLEQMGITIFDEFDYIIPDK